MSTRPKSCGTIGILLLALAGTGSATRGYAVDYSQQPMVIQLSASGGSSRDIVIYSALPPFEVLKELPKMTRGLTSGTAVIPSHGRYGFFEGGQTSSWIIKIDLRTLEAEKSRSPASIPR
jgi:hypothetical protein